MLHICFFVLINPTQGSGLFCSVLNPARISKLTMFLGYGSHRRHESLHHRTRMLLCSDILSLPSLRVVDMCLKVSLGASSVIRPCLVRQNSIPFLSSGTFRHIWTKLRAQSDTPSHISVPVVDTCRLPAFWRDIISKHPSLGRFFSAWHTTHSVYRYIRLQHTAFNAASPHIGNNRAVRG